jgi:hypothetical protein
MARTRELDLAYYTAYHSGLFSQNYDRGKFPDYQKHAPSKKLAVPQKPMSHEQLERSSMMVAIALGATIN